MSAQELNSCFAQKNNNKARRLPRIKYEFDSVKLIAVPKRRRKYDDTCPICLDNFSSNNTGINRRNLLVNRWFPASFATQGRWNGDGWKIFASCIFFAPKTVNAYLLEDVQLAFYNVSNHFLARKVKVSSNVTHMQSVPRVLIKLPIWFAVNMVPKEYQWSSRFL